MSKLQKSQRELLQTIYRLKAITDGDVLFTKDIADELGQNHNNLWNKLDRLAKHGVIVFDEGRVTLTAKGKG